MQTDFFTFQIHSREGTSSQSKSHLDFHYINFFVNYWSVKLEILKQREKVK